MWNKWWRRLLDPKPSDSAGNPRGEPAADGGPKPDPKPQTPDPKPGPKPSEPAEDPKVKEAREEAIKERKKRQEFETRLKEYEEKDKSFKDGLLKLLGKGPEDDPKAAAESAVAERNKFKDLAEKTLVNSAVIAEAVKQGSHDPEAVASLINKEALKIDLESGKVEGAAEAVKELLKQKPYLVKAVPPPPGGGAPPASDPNPKGATQEDYDKLKKEAASGDEGARMKLAQGLSEFRKAGIKL